MNRATSGSENGERPAPQRTAFCVLYRFVVRPGMEEAFVAAWREVTDAVGEQRGGLGSRLHLSDDGVWVAYAQWPDRATWERSRALGTPAPDASARMAEAIESHLPPLPLEPRADLLQPCQAGTD